MESSYKAIPADMAIVGDAMGQMYKYYTSKYFDTEAIIGGLVVRFASISRTDYEGYTVFETGEQLMDKTGFYYPYADESPCGKSGFIQEEEFKECEIHYDNPYTQEKACFALDSDNVVTKMNCDNPTEPDSDDGDLRRRQLQWDVSYTYTMEKDERILKRLESYFEGLPVYNALGDDDGCKAAYYRDYRNLLLSKNSLYLLDDSDYRYTLYIRYDVVRRNVNNETSQQYPSYTEVSITAINDASIIDISNQNFAENYGISIGKYTYGQLKTQGKNDLLTDAFKIIDNFKVVKKGDDAFLSSYDSFYLTKPDTVISIFYINNTYYYYYYLYRFC